MNLQLGALRRCVLLSLLAVSPWAGAQTAILGDTNGAAYVFPNVTFSGACPATVPSSPVTGVSGTPHGVGYYGSDFALISNFGASQVFNVQISTHAVLNTISTGAAGYDGTGSIAVAPSLQYAVMVSNGTLVAMKAPFSAPTFTSVALPGSMSGFQTEGIVFDAASRVYVAHSAGISVLDPPYTSIAFTIPGGAQSIAITPSGNQLLTTHLNAAGVSIYTGPFSAASVAVTLPVPGSSALDGIVSTPDGSRVLVVDAGSSNLFSIAAPYSAASVIDTIPLLAGTGTLEDVSVSADGLYALMTGNSGPAMPFVKGPFTTAGATVCQIPVTGGRGAGAVRFLPTALQPPIGPAVEIVPTLSQWALIALGLLLGLATYGTLRRRGQ